jgi:Na+:H+ antiporter, NhaA family
MITVAVPCGVDVCISARLTIFFFVEGTMKPSPYSLETLFEKILSPFERFLKRTTAGGIILMGTTVLTLILANSMGGTYLHHFWEQPTHLGIGPWHLKLSLHQWVNEGLMTLFFLLVGLELKREVLTGELSRPRDAVLPVAAALGGMLVPAAIYLLVDASGPTAHGWGIPMATDIAFSIGILVLLAWRIPKILIIFLTALAIADDLGAVLIIAIFYTHEISMVPLGSAAGILALLVILNQGGIRHSLPYAILGLLLWLALLKSGIHATISGVLLALTIPAYPVFSPSQLEKRVAQLQETLQARAEDPESCESPLSCPIMATVAENLEHTAKKVQSPQQRMEHLLNPWVTFLVIPIFAFSNAAVDFGAISLWESLGQPVTLGVMLGLIFGKFVGISSFSWLAVKSGLARLPSDIHWRHLLGVSWLGGIGFTMSLFIAQLAFNDPKLVEQAKVGILFASALAGIIGLTWLLWSTSAKRAPEK